MNIDEHAPRNADEPTADYEPTPDETKALKYVETCFEKAKAWRSQYDRNWLDWYRFFRGRQWKDQRPNYRHAEVINFVFQSIQSTIPVLLDARPRIDYVPKEPSDFEFAELMSQLAESDWDQWAWSAILTEVIYDGHFYGAGLSSLTFNPEADFGAGAIEYESADPFHCYPDPDARDVNRKARYFIHAEPLCVDEIKRRYPKKAEFVKADIQDMLKSERTETGRMEMRRPANEYFSLSRTGTSVDAVEKEKALLISMWCCDDDFDETEKEGEPDETGNPTTYYEQRKKYPNGRKIVVCNKVVLEDGPNPHEDGQFPFSRWVNYVLPREFWGISEIEQLESPQRIFNKLVSFALDVLTMTGNPVWIVSNDSDVDTDNLFNRPGLVIEKNPGSEVRREEGTQLQPYVLQLIDRMSQWFNDVAGTQDVTRGATPGSVTAASAISALQEAAQTRIRQKSRNIDTYLQFVGQQYASRALQYYSAPRVFRITSSDGAQKYFKAHFQKAEDGKHQAVVQRWGNGGYELPETYTLTGKLDTRVVTGSSLPFARAEREAKLYQLFDRGIIDTTEVLKGSDYPNWEAVAARMAEKAAQAAAAKEQAPPPAQ